MVEEVRVVGLEQEMANEKVEKGGNNWWRYLQL